MAFSYDLASSDSATAAVSQIRLEIGDTVEGSGPLPDSANLQDAELQYFYSSEGSHVKRAAAAALEALAARWAAYAGSYKLGPESEAFKQAEAYRKAAEQLRARYGFEEDDTAQEQRGAFTIPTKLAGK